jgi:hypothetical protein
MQPSRSTRDDLLSNNPTARKNAADQIGNLGSRAVEAVPAIIGQLSDRKLGFELRTSLVRALGLIGVVNDDVLAALSAAMKDRYPNVRAQAVASTITLLKNSGTENSVDSLFRSALSACDDRIDFVKGSLSELGVAMNERQIAAFAAIMANQQDISLLTCSVEIGKRFKVSAPAIDFMASLLGRNGPELDLNVLRALGSFADQCIGSESKCNPFIPNFAAAIQRARSLAHAASSVELKALARNVRYIDLIQAYHPVAPWERPVTDHATGALGLLGFLTLLSSILFLYVILSNKRHSDRIQTMSTLSEESVNALRNEQERKLTALDEAHQASLTDLKVLSGLIWSGSVGSTKQIWRRGALRPRYWPLKTRWHNLHPSPRRCIDTTSG